MMTIKKLGRYGKGGNAKTDYLLGMAETTHADYYLKGGEGEPAGQWYGRGAAHLGLKPGDTVFPAQLHGIAQGFDPRTYDPARADNDALVQRPGAEHDSGLDCTFTVPKSVSVAWATETPENRRALEEVARTALHTALDRLEKEILTRRGKDSLEYENVDGLFFSVFEHGTARVPKFADGEPTTADPHLHFHVIMSNLCLRKDGTLGAIHNGSAFDQQKLLGAIFRAELCNGLREKLGYHVREGKEGTFEIEGIGDHVIDHFSKRHKAIHAWLAEHREELAAKGITGKKAEEYAWRQTRSAKDSVNRPALFEEWRADAARTFDFGEAALAGIKGKVVGLFHEPPVITVDTVLAKMTASQSVFKLKDIETELWLARQHYDFDVKAKLAEIVGSDKVVLLQDRKGGMFLTTRDLHDREQEIARLTVERRGDTRHRCDAARAEAVMTAFAEAQQAKAAVEGWKFDERIWANQRKAIAHVTTADGQIGVLKGAAGAGKSVSMKCVRQIYDAHGFNVLGCALAGKAAENLQKEAGIPSDTLQGLLTRIEHGHLKLTAKDVVVLDEAGMVDSVLMHRLVTACVRSGARLLAVGEAEQLQAIQAGGPFLMMQRLLAERAEDGKGGIAVLDDITRQKGDYKWLTQAVMQLRRGESADALRALAEHDCLRVAKDEATLHADMVAAWHADPAAYAKKLMIAGTRTDVAELNALARARRREAGELRGLDVVIDVRPREGEATVARAFAERDRIVFGRKDKALGVQEEAVQNGYYGTIERIDRKFVGRGAVLTVRLDDGRLIKFDTANYDAVDHAYAITVHKSQGQTVESCYVLASDRMTDREWGYVALSRSKGATTLYATEDQKDDLAANLARSRMKGTSLDYDAVDKADYRVDGRFDIDALLDDMPKGRFDRKIETLTQAITWGDGEDVKTMLADPKRRAEANVADEKGNTPLHLAVYKGNVAAVEALVAAGATVDVGNRLGFTPLMDAVRTGDAKVVALLVAKGADPFRAAKNGDTPFKFAADLERRAAETGEATPARLAALRAEIEREEERYRRETAKPVAAVGDDATSLLLAARTAYDAKLGALRDELASVEVAAAKAARQQASAALMVEAFGKTKEITLDRALRWRANAAVRAILADPTRQGEVHTVDAQGKTPLHVAAFMKNPAAVKALLAAGAKVDAPDRDGRQPLSDAVRAGDPKTVEILLKGGATPTARDGKGRSVAKIAHGILNQREEDAEAARTKVADLTTKLTRVRKATERKSLEAEVEVAMKAAARADKERQAAASVSAAVDGAVERIKEEAKAKEAAKAVPAAAETEPGGRQDGMAARRQAAPEPQPPSAPARAPVRDRGHDEPEL